MTLHVVGIASSAMALILSEAELTEEELLAKVQDRRRPTSDRSGRRQQVQAGRRRRRHMARGGRDHPACLGLYLNVRMRNGDPDEDFLPRGAACIRRATSCQRTRRWRWRRDPGMYADMAKHVYWSTAVETASGAFDHAFRKSLLNPDCERIGDLNGVEVAMGMPGSLRIVIDGEVADPTELTNTDVTMTITICGRCRPRTAASTWNTISTSTSTRCSSS